MSEEKIEPTESEWLEFITVPLMVFLVVFALSFGLICAMYIAKMLGVFDDSTTQSFGR
jgi:flagellar basal body-associated protein FliL